MKAGPENVPWRRLYGEGSMTKVWCKGSTEKARPAMKVPTRERGE
jgi:hypothetical protein